MSCKHLHIVNSITTTATSSTITLNFSNAVTSLTDKERFCFKIPNGVTIPGGVDGYTVLVAYDDGTIPLWDKYGNPATVSELQNNRGYTGFYGATTPHIISKLPITYNCSCNNVL